jgi:23S rRNA (uridine2552-2'-O)-methyltransferase
MPKSKSSKQWLREHESDPYVLAARQQGYRSRAIFKLIEIDQKDHLFKPGMTIVDLGAAPGGWSEYVAQKVGQKGRVIALDLLPMPAINGVEFIQGDFNDEAIFNRLLDTLHPQLVDVVLCDIAPNMSGNDVIDQAQIMQLAEVAFDFACRMLKPKGVFLVKVFQGEGFQDYLTNLRQRFEKVVSRKPDASRSRSSELYLLAKSFKV